MTSRREPETHPHIAFEREPDVEVARRKSGYGGKKPFQGHRKTHARNLQDATSHTVDELRAKRKTLGVQADKLMVVEVRSSDSGVRDAFEERFGAVVVDERLEQADGQDIVKILVQFPDKEALHHFGAELDLYEKEVAQRGLFTQKQREQFFDAVVDFRSPGPTERMGPRLREEGWNESLFSWMWIFGIPGQQTEHEKLYKNFVLFAVATMGR